MPHLAKASPLATYESLGLHLKGREINSGGQVVSDCPFCGKERKFYINADNGKWICMGGSCQESGNPLTFLRKIWQASWEGTSIGAGEGLAQERGLLCPETLSEWGGCISTLSGEWIFPGYGIDGKEVGQIYRYTSLPNSGGRRALLPTAGMELSLFGPNHHDPDRANHYDSSKPDVYLCEGIWDAMALWETLKAEDGERWKTGNVLAVPGALTFQERWGKLLAGKRVFLLYDSDHPRVNKITGKEVLPVGHAGMRKVVEVVSRATGASDAPSEILYLDWGGEGKGWDPGLEDGWDIRDCLRQGEGIPQRISLANQILSKAKPIPPDWLPGRKRQGTLALGQPGNSYKEQIDILPCRSWKELVNAWRKALKWTEGLDRALSVMLAVIASTETVGDQLWVKILGPPSCGKTTLCEALAVNKKYIYSKDTFTGLVSGYQTDKGGDEDQSLAPKLKNKTLVINDGDTLISLPNRAVVLSHLRAFYSRNIRSQYGNKMSKNHEGINATLILCGTGSLRVLDASELGERTLDCMVTRVLDEELEDEVALMKAYQANREMAYRSDGKMVTRDSPEMVEAKRLTGGFVNHLREGALRFFEGHDLSEAHLKECTRLGKFVAMMRARPSVKQDEKVERELSFRLVSQCVRMAKALCYVLGSGSPPVKGGLVDDGRVESEAMARLREIVIDTAQGKTYEMVSCLYKVAEKGMESSTLGYHTDIPDEKMVPFLKFLRRMKVVESFSPDLAFGKVRGRSRWRLTRGIHRLYEEIARPAV